MNEHGQRAQRLFSFLLFCVPLVVIAIVFRDAFFLDRMYYNGDTMLQFFQYFNFFSEDSGRIAHGILSGFPLDTTVTGIWYYPINKVFLALFDSFDAYKFLLLFDLCAAYVLSFLYARKIGLRFETSILTAMIFLFSGQLMLWSTTATNANYFFLLPAVLLAVEFSRTSRRKFISLVATGVLFGVGWLSGHIQFIIYIHIFFAIYYFVTARYRHCRGCCVVNPVDTRETGDCPPAGEAGFVAKPPRNDNGFVGQFIRNILDVLIAFLISLLIGFPQIKAIIGFLGQTSRINSVTLHEFFSGSLYPQDIIHFLLPFWSNPVIRTGIPSLFIGVLPFVLLVFGFFLWRRHEHSHARFYLAAVCVCLLLSVMYSPIGLALYAIPFVNSFREWSRVMFIGNFAASLVVGFTLEYLLAHSEGVKTALQKYVRVIRWFVFGIFIPIVAVVSILKIFAFERFQEWIHDYVTNTVVPRSAGLPLEHYLALADQYVNDAFGQLYIGNHYILVALVSSVASIWLLMRLGKDHFLLGNFSRKETLRFGEQSLAEKTAPSLVSVKPFIVVSILIVAFNFVGVYGAYFQSVSRSELYEASGTVRAIQEKSRGQVFFRVFSLFPGVSEYNELVIRCATRDAHEVLAFQKSVLTPNMNMLWGIDSIDAYENYMPIRVAEMLAYVGSERATVGELVAHESIPLGDRIQKVIDRKNVLRSMNVRFVLSHEEIRDPDFAEIYRNEVGKCKTQVHVYELSNSWPRYFTTGSYSVIPPNAENVFEYSSEYLSTHTIQDGILLEKDLHKTFERQEIKPMNPVIGKDRLSLEIEMQKPGLLFIGNAWLPGWRATVNGSPIEILRANYTYMAILLGEGENEVELRYDD